MTVAPLERFLPSRPGARSRADIELHLWSSFAGRLGISVELLWEIYGFATRGRRPLHSGPDVLPNDITADQTRQLYPVEWGAALYMHEVVWVQHDKVKLGAFEALIAKLRAEHGTYAQPDLFAGGE